VHQIVVDPHHLPLEHQIVVDPHQASQEEDHPQDSHQEDHHQVFQEAPHQDSQEVNQDKDHKANLEEDHHPAFQEADHRQDSQEVQGIQQAFQEDPHPASLEAGPHQAFREEVPASRAEPHPQVSQEAPLPQDSQDQDKGNQDKDNHHQEDNQDRDNQDKDNQDQEELHPQASRDNITKPSENISRLKGVYQMWQIMGQPLGTIISQIIETVVGRELLENLCCFRTFILW